MNDAYKQLMKMASEQSNNTLARMNALAPRMPAYADYKLPVPPRVPSVAENLHNALYPLIQGQAENFVRILQQHIQALEQNLKEGESLCVYCNDGTRRIQVREFRFPTWNIGILSGSDENENPTQLITHINGVQITYQIIGATEKRGPIGFYVPHNNGNEPK